MAPRLGRLILRVDPSPVQAETTPLRTLRSAEKGTPFPFSALRPVAQVVPREGRGRSASHPPNRLQDRQQTHPADIPQEIVGSSRRSPAMPANHRDRSPALAGNPRLSPLSSEAPRPACHAGGRVRVPSLPSKYLQINIVRCQLRRGNRADYTNVRSRRVETAKEGRETRFEGHHFKPFAAASRPSSKAACDYTEWPEVTDPSAAVKSE